MKHNAVLVLLLVGLLSTATAQEVNSTEAAQAAAAFLNSHQGTHLSAADLKAVPLDEMPHLRVFVSGSEAFVVMPTDRRIDPILGYSFENAFPQPLHPELRYWLSTYEEQLAALPPATDASVPHFRWAMLTSGKPTDAANGDEADADVEEEEEYDGPRISAIPFLCNTVWDQAPFYNNFCPYDSNAFDRTVVGCTATAMAQIMKYWNHPSCGTGSYSYTHRNYGTISADFANTTYIWSKMPYNLSMGTPADQVEATARLSFHCGVAAGMDYGISANGGSGAYVVNYGNRNMHCAENAFRDYFKYSNDLHGEMRSSYTDSAWIALIDYDLEHGRPILYSGYDISAGHAFVLDGRDTSGRYHFNWGWSGTGNGMYHIDSLNVGTGGIGANSSLSFNLEQHALFGVVPIPEVFDTVEYFDTFCPGMGQVTFFEYDLPSHEADYQLIHLNTVYNLHIAQTERRQAYMKPNGGSGAAYYLYFCPPTGIVMPECTFTRNGYKFVGWSLNYRGEGDIYQPGEVLPRRTNCMLYAIWELENAGINQADGSNVSIYPNPAHDLLTIAHSEGCTYRLTDALGRPVLQGKLSSDNVQISLKTLCNGLYFLLIEAPEGNSITRIIKQ